MDTASERNPEQRSAAPPGLKRYLRFSLRSMLLAITLWSVLVCAVTSLGLVEALETMLGPIGLLVLLAWFHREYRVARRPIGALLAVLHVLATLGVVVCASLATEATELWTWSGMGVWALAGALMCPVALVHHAVCYYCGWGSGLAQPGTFFLVVVLNSLLWANLWRWRQQRRQGAGTTKRSVLAA